LMLSAVGVSSAISIASGTIKALANDIRPDQVTLIVTPPHLIDKWKRELVSITPKAFMERLDRHEKANAFTAKAETLIAYLESVHLIVDKTIWT